ncbi:hypothetical protein AWENTII_010979 [Aspergillus wentii]
MMMKWESGKSPKSPKCPPNPTGRKKGMTRPCLVPQATRHHRVPRSPLSLETIYFGFFWLLHTTSYGFLALHRTVTRNPTLAFDADSTAAGTRAIIHDKSTDPTSARSDNNAIWRLEFAQQTGGYGGDAASGVINQVG